MYCLKYFVVLLILLIYVNSSQEYYYDKGKLRDTIWQKCSFFKDNDTPGNVVKCVYDQVPDTLTRTGFEELQPLSVTTLLLTGRTITNLPKIPQLSIDWLVVTYASLQTLEEHCFSELSQLKHLSLSNNDLTTDALSKRIFEPEPIMMIDPTSDHNMKLVLLLLSHNNIKSLPLGLFSFVPNLTELDLSWNPLGDFDSNTTAEITKLTNLRELRLSHCELTTFPEALFRALSSLQTLDISANKFTTIPASLADAVNLKYLDLDYNTFETIPSNSSLSSLSNLEELHLCRLNELRSIGPNALGLASLKRLYINDNPKLDELDSKALIWVDGDGTEKYSPLKKLNLQNNKLSTIKKQFWDRWDNLFEVDLSGNPYQCDCDSDWMLVNLVPHVNYDVTSQMRCSGPEDFKGESFYDIQQDGRSFCPNKVTRFICKNCCCTRKKRTNEGHIDCRESDISSPFTLGDWKGLKPYSSITLDLSSNYLSRLAKFPALPIRTVILSSCYLKTIDDHCFSELTELVHLDLSFSTLTTSTLDRKIFEPVSITENSTSNHFLKLKHLDLSYNKIESLPSDLFTFTPRITALNLTRNPLRVLDGNTRTEIMKLTNLKDLRLNICELTTLPEDLFRALRSLEILDISDNKFSTIPAALSDAVNLKYLDLSGIQIETIDRNTSISSLSRLQELHLCDNYHLRSIGPHAFGGLHSLETLSIRHNVRLTQLDPTCLMGVGDFGIETYPPLKQLDLSNNDLASISESLLPRWDSLSSVDLSRNPYQCDCHVQWILDEIVPPLLEVNDEGTWRRRSMYCSGPEELKGVSFVQLKKQGKSLCPEPDDFVTEDYVPTSEHYGPSVRGLF